MNAFQAVLFVLLIVCAISVSFSKNLLNSIIIFMSYSLIMSIIWILLESPDLAITEAAVGAGITSILFFVTLKKIHAIIAIDEDKEDPHSHDKGSHDKESHEKNRHEKNSRDRSRLQGKGEVE